MNAKIVAVQCLSLISSNISTIMLNFKDLLRVRDCLAVLFNHLQTLFIEFLKVFS